MNSSEKSDYPNSKQEPGKKSSKNQFKTREALSDWIEASLEELERKFAAFKTENSKRSIKISR